MPELIRLQTPDFEFSVWAKDISQRAKVYQATVAKRASLALKDVGSGIVSSSLHSENTDSESAYQLRFSPAIELVDISFNQNNHVEQAPMTANNTSTEKRAVLILDTPIFFENVQYQFEWIFYGAVADASLAHRSQSVSESFRFVKQRGVIPARLIGNINTGNNVGWMHLPLSYEVEGKTYRQRIAFEVLPTKMVLEQDLSAMYQAIDSVYPLWRFSMVEKTEQDAAADKQRGHFPLMWLANFSVLRARFEQGLKVICAAPHSRLQPKVENIKAAKFKGHISHKLAEQVKQDFAIGKHDMRYRVVKKQLSVDTPENRFIKMVVMHSKRKLADFEARLRISNLAPESQRLSKFFLNELHSWQQPLQKILSQSFLKDVGGYKDLRRESLVLQQKIGYSTVYRVWQELKYYLDIFGNQSSISMKSVAEIYEVWCFLSLKNILEQDLGFVLVDDNTAKLTQNDFFEYQLKDGFAGAFRFKRDDGLTARLAHEPKFTKKGNSIRSYLVNQEPDIVLEITLPKTEQGDEKQFIWLFDAKYRIKTDKDRVDGNADNFSTTDFVPDDAINQLHRYRDALIRLSNSEIAPSDSALSSEITAISPAKKSRPVFGAFALYPGYFDQAQERNPYAEAIEEVGIGAFAMLPSQVAKSYCGHQWLLDFLHMQIGTAPITPSRQTCNNIRTLADMTENIYVQEAARITYYGMRQVLYPDLTMTAALGFLEERFPNCFEQFKNGTLNFYYLPVSTFMLKFKTHVIDEIRYLAIIPNHLIQHDLSEVWPVRNVQYIARSQIDISVTGKENNSDELYILFELGKPFSLRNRVIFRPDGTFRHSIRLTTMRQLELVKQLDNAQVVYEDTLD
jgi:hypothetical protein